MAKHTIDTSLDAILEQLGDFGKYQFYIFTLVCIPVILHSAVHVAYVFLITGCDAEPTEYEPAWLPNAVPYSNERPAKCEMYVFNFTETDNSGNCSSSDFDKRETRRCTSFVYETNEKCILQEANIWIPLPLVCFSGMTLTAGCLSLLFPKTLNIKLPDTIEEAKNISKLAENIE